MYPFPNEVYVSKEDKDRLVELLGEANAILNKYPYFSKSDCNCVTTMSRAKSSVKEANQWCSYLHTEDEKKER